MIEMYVALYQDKLMNCFTEMLFSVEANKVSK